MSPQGFWRNRVLSGPLIIAVVIGVSAGAFVYTAGWISPERLTPEKLVSALAPPGGAALGHRRNHAKGICFVGFFEGNGIGLTVSRARAFALGRSAVIGRFNLGTADPNAKDATVRVRGLGLQITSEGGEVWRSAMIDPPVFPVSSPQHFYDLLIASGSKEPDAMKKFTATHPEFAGFLNWANSAPWTPSFAEDRYNSLNSFTFTNDAGESHVVRWSLIPAAQPTAISAEALAKRGPNYLESELLDRVQKSPQRWTMNVTLASQGDPTGDPTKLWPSDRKVLEVGTLTVKKIIPEADGPCRDINFDPTVLPPGISTSDDPFPAARSAAYSRSYNSRTAEASNYPRKTGATEQ